MRKSITSIVLATAIAAAALSSSNKAEARCYGCWAGAGIAAALIGSAILSNSAYGYGYWPAYYGGYGYSPYAYGYAPPYYARRYYAPRYYYGGPRYYAPNRYVRYAPYYRGYYGPRRVYARGYYGRRW